MEGNERMILSTNELAIGLVLLAALPIWWWMESKLPR